MIYRWPTQVHGRGPPIMVGHGLNRRLLADGGGLCSPGLWPPHERHAAQGVAEGIQKALVRELDAWDRSLRSGLNGLFNEFAQGKAEEDPFPPEATRRLKNLLAEVSAPFRITLDPGDVLQDQPIDVLLLGSVLRSLGDPDWEVFRLYATGVPLGMGVQMPRTPKVFPPKQKWSLPEQEAWGVLQNGQTFIMVPP